MGTTAKGFRYPDLTDPPNGPADIGNLAQDIDDVLDGLTYAEINALTGGDVWAGRVVYQSNTGTNRPEVGLYQHNGVEWRKPWNLPWGALPNGIVTTTSVVTGAGAETNAGLALTNTLVANRLMRVKFRCGYHQNSSGTAVFLISDGTNSHRVASITNGAGDDGRMGGEYEFVSTAGSLTMTARVSSAAGTVDLVASSQSLASLTWEDLGPAGSPA